MTMSKISHAQSYSYSKFNQAIASARLYYKQGAFAKAFETYLTTHKNTGFELEQDDILMCGQCLVNILEQSFEKDSFEKKSIHYLNNEIDKLASLHINENSFIFAKNVVTPILECISNDINRNKCTPEILWAYRDITDHIAKSCIIPTKLEIKINEVEDRLVDEIMQKIKRWYEQQLYTLAAIHAENKIHTFIAYYPNLGKKLLNQAVQLFKKHKQCPQRLIDNFSKITTAIKEEISMDDLRES